MTLDSTSMPVLRSARLTLRPVALADVEAFHALWQTPVTRGFVGRAPSQSLDETRERVQQTLRLQASGEVMSWALAESLHAPMMGVVGLCRFVTKHHRAEVAYELLPAFQGQGVMREALNALCLHAFDSLKLHRVEGHVDPRNHRSIAVLVGCGFRFEGTLRDTVFLDGHYYDSSIYGRLAPTVNTP